MTLEQQRAAWTVWANALDHMGRWQQAELIRSTMLDPQQGNEWLRIANQYRCIPPNPEEIQ